MRRGYRPRERSVKRAAQSRKYNVEKALYLQEHPFCQIFIARHGLDEDEVKRENGLLRRGGHTIVVPIATQIHHRNKRDGERLLDQRWWMSACQMQHDYVEANKSRSRELGLLLPIQADADGCWGAGQSALPTPEFLRVLAWR